MTKATWRVVDYGRVPTDAETMDFQCPGCGHIAQLPVLGIPLAELTCGVVFDHGDHALPQVIACRKCRRQFEVA